MKIFEHINKDTLYLKDFSKTSRGLPYQKHVSNTKSKYKIYRGKHIGRFLLRDSDEFLPDAKVDLTNAKIQFLLKPKVISQRIVAHVTKPKDHIIIMSTLDRNGVLSVDTVENTIVENEEYPLEFITSLFNSKLISWYAYRFIFAKAIRTMDFDNYYVGKIPIPIKIKNMSDFVKLTNMIISLNNQLESVSKYSDKENAIKRNIEKIDGELNKMIYKSYGLKRREIKIIEASFE